MADSRIFTDYRPTGYVNDLVRMQNGITNSYDYRQFLIHNAEAFMNAEQQYLMKKTSINVAQIQEVPDQTECLYDTHSSVCYPVNSSGVGMSNRASSQLPTYSNPK